MNYNEKSILKTKDIKKVLLNKKGYKFQDFTFKIVEEKKGFGIYSLDSKFIIEIYNFNVLILQVEASEYTDSRTPKGEKRFMIEVEYFNPQTNNDCQSINHIIAVFNDLVVDARQHDDKGNYNKLLSHEVAINEYLTYVKDIFGFKQIQRRKIKAQVKAIIDKIILTESLMKDGNNKK